MDAHPDIKIENAQVPDLSDTNDDTAQQTGNRSNLIHTAPSWVYASEERIWQAIAGHTVDRKRIPAKLFDILEVVAAAGPDGILQPEVRKLTDQDKQSIPLRTDKLADRGYIVKEKISVPKMITSRLRLWRFTNEDSAPPGDSILYADRPKDEYVDHFECFDAIVRMLQSNDGIALMEEIRHETGCTTTLKRKALLRCINRLENRGLLRRIKARVENESKANGSDHVARCLQLLRDPTELDREAMIGKGGPSKLDGEGQSNAQSRAQRYNGPVRPGLLDGATEGHDEDEDAVIARQSGTETSQLQRLNAIERSISAGRLEAAHPTTNSNVQDTGMSTSLATPRKKMPVQASSSGQGQHALSASPRFRAPASLQDSNSLPLTGDRNASGSQVGVFFTTHLPEKRKVGRPKKSLIAVFKSPKLKNPSRIIEGESSLDEPPAAFPGPQPMNEQVVGHSQGAGDTREADNSQNASTSASVSTPRVSNAPSFNDTIPSSRRQAAAVEEAETLSNHMLGQRRRREKERAKKAIAATAVLQQVDQLNSADEPLTAPVSGDAESLSKASLNQTRCYESERAKKSLALDSVSLQTDGSGSAPTAADEHCSGSSRTPGIQSAAKPLQHESETPSKRSLGQRRRHEQRRAATAMALAAASKQSGDSGQASETDRSTLASNGLPTDRTSSNSKHKSDDAAQRRLPRHSETASVMLGNGQHTTASSEGEDLPIASFARDTRLTAQDSQTLAEMTHPGVNALPPLSFVAVEPVDGLDPALSIDSGPNSRTSNAHGTSRSERLSIIMNIVRACHGVFPGAREMVHAFTTVWLKDHTGSPDIRTVSRLVDTLRRDRKLDMYEFRCPDGKGGKKIRHILIEPNIDPASEQVRSVQRRMIDLMPGIYMPPGVEISDSLRQRRRHGKSIAQKRQAPEKEVGEERPLKRRRLSANELLDGDDPVNGYDSDEDFIPDGEVVEPEWNDNFPAVSGVTVKRTTARRVSDDQLAAGQASKSGARAAQSLREASLAAASTADVVRSPADQTIQFTTGPKRGGWPKGRPRKRIAKFAVDNNIAALLSLLFSPQQFVHPSSGTFGTFSPVYVSTHLRTDVEDGRRDKIASAKRTVLGKRSTDQTSSDHDVAAALLVRPGQSKLESTGTFLTNGIVPIAPRVDDAGRGKRVKRSTEKAFDFQKALRSPSPDEVPTKRATLGSQSQLVDDRHGLVSKEYTKAHPESTWVHRGQGRWARVLEPADAALNASMTNLSTDRMAAPVSRPTPKPKGLAITASASPYSKPPPGAESMDRVSTDYVNQHPAETWYHVGHGRWARGLPPPGASYKTAVKGPEAKAYLARIGTAEGKSKKHGAFVNGQQLKRNGEPWQRQPFSVNGVSVRPRISTTAVQPETSQSQPSTPSGGGSKVHYEVPKAVPTPLTHQNSTAGQPGFDLTPTTSRVDPSTTPSKGMYQAVTAPRPLQLILSPAAQGLYASVAQDQSILPVVKRKRPYTYKSRKQLSSVGADGITIAPDRDSDDDYAQTRSPKRQRKNIQAAESSAKTKYTIDRKRLSIAVALVRNLAAVTSAKDVRWDLVALALQMSDKGAAAEIQYRSITHYGPNAKFVTAVQEEMQEPFLAALESGDLPTVDHVNLARSDWPALLQWAETNIIPLITEERVKSAKRTSRLHVPTAQASKTPKSRVNRPIVDMTPMFPATYVSEPKKGASRLDLNEDLIVVKSWIRANSTTQDDVYDNKKATEKLSALGTTILQAVQEMQESGTIRQLKKGRQRPGRNFEITQHVWEQFKTWPGADNGPTYLRSLSDARANIVEHFAQSDTLQLDAGAPDPEALVLGSMLAQGMLTMEVQLPERNDDVDAPFPKLNAWSYGGPRHDTRKIDRSVFDLPVIYTKTAAFSAEHSLRTGTAPPGPLSTVPGEALPRVPFWIDINGNLMSDIWEKVLSSMLHQVVKKPGITAKGIEEAHCNKLWTWEIELALEWMKEVGIAGRFGAGREIDGVWKGGWTVGKEWYCALAQEVATWGT